VTGISAQNVELTDLTFSGNGLGGGGGTGDVQFFEYNGDATLTDLTLVGSATATTGARLGIQFRGTGGATGTGVQAMGDVTLDGVDVSGDYRTQMIGIQRYSDVSNLTFTDVALGGATSEITGSFGASLRFDAVGFGSIGAPASVDLGNTLFRGLDGASAQRHEIEIAPDNAHTFLRADGTGTTWTIGGVDVAASSLTLAQAFAVEDRILHYVDKLNPIHGTYKGFVDIQTGQAFIGDDAPTAGVIGDGSIQRGVDIVAAGGTVNVENGTFIEQVSIAKDVTVRGQSQAGAIVQAPPAMTLDNSFVYAGVTRQSVIAVTAGTVNIEDLTVDGAGAGATVVPGNDFHGIGIHNADVTIDSVTVTGVRDSVLGGAQRGRAIFAGNDTGLHTVTVTGSTVNDFQKNGIDLRGAGLTGVVTGNTVTGSGPTSVIAQNGIALVNGAAGTISGNTVSGHVYTGVGASAAGILLFSAGAGTTVSNNLNITGNQLGIATDSAATISGNVVSGSVAEGIRVSGGAVSVLNNNVTSSGIGLNLSGGSARVQGNTLNGNTIGARITGSAIADLGRQTPGTDASITGLPNSTGGNDFSGYTTTATATSGAVVNLKAEPAVGRQGAPPDVPAFGNIWAVNTPTGIENVVYHDIDNSALGFVDFAAFAFTGAVTVSDDDVLEGDSVTVSGSFSNVPQPHTVTIDWGDGSTPTVINLPAGVYNFSSPHVYEDDQDGNQPPTNTTTYPITVTIADASMATIVDNSLSVDVTNVAPTVLISGPTSAGDGQTLSYTFTTTDPGEGAGDVFTLNPITVTTLGGSATGVVSNVVFNASTGIGSFDVTFSSPPGTGSVQITVDVEDDDEASGVDTHVVTVGNTLRVINFQINDSGFDVTFNRALDLTDLNLYDGVNPLVVGDMLRAADIVVHASVANVDVNGSVVYNAATNTLSWVKTGGVLASDNYMVTLRSGSDAFKDMFGTTLDGNSDFVAGDNYQQAFNVTIVGGTPIVSLPDFARGPGQGVDLTANSTVDVSLPVRATGTNVQGVDFQLVYDTALLTINPLAVTAVLPGWSVFTSQTIVGGIATLTVAAFTASPINAFSGTANVVNIGAMVPSSAPYGASQVLRLQNTEVNDDLALDDAAFQKVMFPGDANGSGILPGSMPPNAYTGEDASLIARVVVGSDGTTGFDATPLVDPAIVGDASGNGGLNAFDASLVAQEAAAFNTPEVPDETAPGSGGFAAFDPTLIIDDGLFGNVGRPVQIPVKIAIEPTVVGVTSATYTVTFDPNVLSFVGFENGADFGAGWTVNANETPAGTINVSMFSAMPSGNNGGLPQELTRLNFTVAASALGLQSNLNIQPVDPNELGLIWTEDDGSIRGTYTADFDRDGDVDDDDLTRWENGFGTQPNATVGQGDENGDGDVDGFDFLAWQQQKGSVLPPLPPATASSVESFTAASSASVMPAYEVEVVAAVELSDSTSLALNFEQPSSWWLDPPTSSLTQAASSKAKSGDVEAAFDAWSYEPELDDQSEPALALVSATSENSLVADGDDSTDEAFDAFGAEFGAAMTSWMDG
jgi:hypothetical protein